MSDSDGQDVPRVGKRKLAVYLAVCFIVGAAGVAGAAHLANSVYVDGGVPIGTPDGLYVTVEGQTQMDLSDPTTLGGTANIVTEQGNATFYSPGQASATVNAADIEGTWTTVTNINADANTIQIDPGDKDQVTVGSELTRIEWRTNIAADDGTVDFAYVGGTGNSRVTLNGVSADTRLAAVDASTGTVLDEATSGSGGSVTFDELDSGTHDVTIQSFEPHTPALSNAAPTGQTASPPTELSVDVTDGDFPRGDSVTVEFTLDGSVISTQTITSNETVTASVPSSGQTGGDHEWNVTATDDYGESTRQNNSYSVPTTLFIHDEETAEAIDDQQVNLTVYTRDDTPEILSFNTSDGEVDLASGFPSSEPFVVVAESEGYLDRRIYVQNVYETQDLYLLNESVASTEIIFAIEDYTGRYPPDQTVLQVQRGINGNWTTVLGDYFGANDQFTAQIKHNTRHRLVLRNSRTGDRRVLGTYTPLTSAQETLTISPSGNLELPEEYPRTSIEPGARTLPAESGVGLSARVTNGTQELTSWNVTVYHVAPDGTETTLSSESGSDPSGGTSSPTVDLSDRNGTVKVVTNYELASGVSGSRVASYSISASSARSMTILEGIAGIVTLVPAENQGQTTSFLAMVLVVLGTGAVGRVARLSAEGMGVVTAVLVTAFAVLGWLPYSLMFTVVVVFGALTLLRRRY